MTVLNERINLTETDDADSAEAINSRASDWMKRGISLLNTNNAHDLAEAVRCFDRAIELRRALPLEQSNWFRYGLAAGWMNRGDALTRLGGEHNLAAAVSDYDEALEVLRELPMEKNFLFRRRNAIAWLNRGITLQAQNTPVSLAEAARSFERTINLLEDPAAVRGDDERRILAAAWMNCGNVLLSSHRLDSARSSALSRFEHFPSPEDGTPNMAKAAARKSLEYMAVDEATDLVAAEIGFKARHILCRAIAHLLEMENQAQSEKLVAEATDAVDEAMNLARVWEDNGVAQFRPLAAQLFHFGCRIYQSRQPHFLVEFLMENLDPEHSPGAIPDNHAMHASAVEALWRSLAEIQREGFKSLNTPRFEQVLEQLRDLRVTEERLIELRKRYLTVNS